MGRMNNNAEQKTKEANSSEQQQIQHFSHPHALQLTNQPQNPSIPCLACKSTLSGPTYSCFPCNYFLHPSCSKLPRKIKHPFDANGHTLYLLPVPPYPEGSFRCDACGKNGTGFCYNCEQCGIDLHTACAAMPLLVPHGSHVHQLDLTFSPPYHNKTFSCDLCRITGSNHWLYRCHSCEFDVHLDCATGKSSQAAPIQSQPRRIVNNNQQNYPNPPRVQFQQPIPMNPGVQYRQVRPPNLGVQYQQPRPVGYQNAAMVNNCVNGFVNGASQAVGQNLMMGALGAVGLGGSGAAGGGGAYAGGGGAYAGGSGAYDGGGGAYDGGGDAYDGGGGAYDGNGGAYDGGGDAYDGGGGAYDEGGGAYDGGGDAYDGEYTEMSDPGNIPDASE